MKKLDVTKAQTVLAGLDAQREALVARGHELEQRRQTIAFDAHSGNKSARAKLDEINSESITFGYELKGLDSAIAETTKRLAAADAAEALAQDREDARALRSVVDEFVAHALAIDEAIASMVNEANALSETLIKIHSLGCAFPSYDQLNGLGAPALGTAIMNTPWRKDFEHLAPSQRQSFPKLISDWASRIESNHIAPHIGALKEVA